MSKWYKASVSKIKREANGLSTIELNVADTPLHGTHLSAGQYVKLALEGKGEGYFAIASRPGKQGRAFQFLIKHGSPLADGLQALKVGAAVDVSLPSGKGFPLEAAQGKNVLLFATGSGISPIRSVIEVIRGDRKAFKEVTLYFGAKTPDAFAYVDELEAWKKDSIRVIRTVSEPGGSGWSGLTGYVQSHVSEVDPKAVAFVAGQKQMVHDVTSALTKCGMPKENVFLNF